MDNEGVLAAGSLASDDASPPSASLVPPAPAPRPVYSFSPGVDLYATANWLFVFCASGYLILDASRVAFPRDTIQSFRGSNATNAWFFFFSSLYVMDCTLYFLVYNKWEREALEAASLKRRRNRIRSASASAAAEGQGQYDDSDSDFEEEERAYTARQQRAESRAAAEEEKQSGSGAAGLKHRPGHGSSASLAGAASASGDDSDFAAALSKSASRVARKARWCFFSHEGGLINVLEIVAALIFLMDAAMTFFAGIAAVARPIQRRWDSATMTGDAVASAIFLADSIVFYHIYVRTLQKPKEESSSAAGAAAGTAVAVSIPEEAEGMTAVVAAASSPSSSSSSSLASSSAFTVRVSGFQPRDPWFWTAVLNVGGSLVYFVAAVWGIVRQNVHANQDLVSPGSYDANMLWLTQKLHAIYLGGDVLYVLCGSCLVYVYSRDRKADALAQSMAAQAFDPDNQAGHRYEKAS